MSEELNALEAGLRQLAPRAPTLDRDALMFRAGRASAPRGWAWPLAAAASTLVAVALGMALALRPDPPTSVRVVQVPAPEPAPSPGPEPVSPPAPTVSGDSWSPESSRYFRLQEQVLRWGLDGLPPLPPATAPPEPATLDNLLRLQ
jgi:hypothetical protein